MSDGEVSQTPIWTNTGVGVGVNVAVGVDLGIGVAALPQPIKRTANKPTSQSLCIRLVYHEAYVLNFTGVCLVRASER